MSLFAELKRRNVLRVLAAYLVSAWLLIEVGSLMFDAFDFPDWAPQILILILALGLLPVVIFAWAYELTPEGLKRESQVDHTQSISHHTGRRLDQITIAMILVALGVIMVDQFILEESAQLTEPAAATSPPSVAATETAAVEAPVKAPTPDTFEPDPNSVAVLPFVNMSPDPDNEYFSDGISEELLNLLVRIEGLRVPSRTSSFAFKGRNTDIHEIAQSLDVAHILEGSVRKAGDRVRITAQLIDVRDDRHIWSETYDRQLTDIFAIQDEIAGKIISALQVALGTVDPVQSTPRDIEAYDLYLQGLHFFRQREGKLLESERLLKQALEREPEFAEAWATLALVYVVQPYYLDISRDEVRPRAREAAERALALNPQLADPRAVQALLHQWDYRWRDAIDIHESLAADHPNHSLSRVWYGILLLETGYVGEALSQLEAGYKLDPVSGVAVDWLSRALIMDGQDDRGRKLAERAVQLDRSAAYLQLLAYHLHKGSLNDFEKLVAQAPEDRRALLELAVLALRDPQRADEAIAALEDEGRLGRYYVAQLYKLLARAGEFFSFLRAVMETDETSLAELWYPESTALRQHPLMKDFAKDYRLLDLWQARGWPDLCRPVGEEDFECD